MEILNDYLVVVVAAICFAVGFIIHGGGQYPGLDFIPNKFIPLIMGLLGIFLNTWMNAWAFTPQVLLGGLASGLASTGGFELVKNLVPTGETVISGEIKTDSQASIETSIQTRAPGEGQSSDQTK